MRSIFKATLAILIAITGSNALAQSAAVDAEQQRFRSAADYSRENRGLSVVVLKGDKIVFEEYQNGHSADRPWILASGTKSFSGVMLAAAIEDKLISGFDEKVSDTIVEWKADKSKASITLRQLLSLTSGIDAGQIGRVPSYAEAINEKVTSAPGTAFEYGPVPFQIFGELMTRKLKAKNETVYEYLERRILKPIGINVGFWRKSNGQPLLPQGASLTAREWLKFGQFLRDHGKWNGKQLIAKKLLDELVVGTKANPAYGLTFWLNRDGKGPAGRPGRRNAVMEISENGIANGLADMYMAAGAGNQRLYMIPSLDMVVVRQASFGDWDASEFISRLIGGRKLP